MRSCVRPVRAVFHDRWPSWVFANRFQIDCTGCYALRLKLDAPVAIFSVNLP